MTRCSPISIPRPGRAGKILGPGRAGKTLLLLLLGGAGAPAGLRVDHAWIRFITAPVPAAGYFVLSNDTNRSVTLTGAMSPDCGALMLHRSMNSSGMDRMQAVNSVSVPAGDKLAFEPGSYHLMCMHPAERVAPGGHMPVTLLFQGGRRIETRFPVYGANGPSRP